MFARSVLIATLALAASAFSAPAQASWCAEGVGALLVGSSQGPGMEIQQVMQKCKPGDTIGIPGNSSAVIGTLCDFTKAIYREPNGLAICVIRKP